MLDRGVFTARVRSFGAPSLYPALVACTNRCTPVAKCVPPGVPPWDLLEEIGQQLRQQHYDVDDVFQRAASVSNEWTYDPCRGGGGRLRDRFQPKFNRERTMALKWRTLAETLNPQPCAST